MYECTAEHPSPYNNAGLHLNQSGLNSSILKTFKETGCVTPAGNLAGNMLAGFINSASLDKLDPRFNTPVRNTQRGRNTLRTSFGGFSGD